jgi:hypothetical protein
MLTENPLVKYSSYTEAQKKATTKYRNANKEKINEMRKAYYLKRKENDKEFIEYKRKKAREYYHKKKQEKEHLKQNLKEQETKEPKETKLEEIKEIVIVEIPAEELQEKIINEPKIEKVIKSKRVSRKKTQ